MANSLSPLHASARLDDASSPLAVSYELPHVPTPDASPAQLGEVVEQLEAHLARLKFVLFLREVASLWPKDVDALGIRVSGSDLESAVWHVRCWKTDRRGLLVDKIAPPSFTQQLTSLPHLTRPEVFQVASVMFAADPHPLSKEEWAGLELECQPLEVRARLLSELMASSLPKSSAPAGSAGPRM